jgi:hypothetical protein
MRAAGVQAVMYEKQRGLIDTVYITAAYMLCKHSTCGMDFQAQ